MTKGRKCAIFNRIEKSQILKRLGNMPKLTINGKEVEIESGATVLQACERAGAEIPVFCYHSRLKIAGNCRMCLVEIEKSPKPIASCAMPASEGMVIHTNTPMVEKARKGVLEFLLANHPLDCPICDQGGECDLQDITMAYGPDKSRFKENKRAVKDKNFGPLIKTAMTRCIQCTRCVRFSDDIAGVHELGAVYRGEYMEISTYIQKALYSELSGNMIDICPVGALTSKPYAYKGRSWELTSTESVDVLDAVGSNIRVDTRGLEVMRILPRLNEDINEEWISDKTRFAYDGLKYQRLDRPYIRKEGKLEEVSWEEIWEYLKLKLKNIKGEEIGAIAGNLADAEALFSLKSLLDSWGSPYQDVCQEEAYPYTEERPLYLFNTSIAGIEESDVCLLIGTNPRWEAALVNARLRKRYLMGNFTVGLLGEDVELNYPYTLLGSNPKTLEDILNGKHPFSEILKKAQHPMIILGTEVLKRKDAQAIQYKVLSFLEEIEAIREDWIGYNILHTSASRVAALDLGFFPRQKKYGIEGMKKAAKEGTLKVLYLLGADEINPKDFGNVLTIYQGHHGDQGANGADIILPGAAYTEKSGTYVNMEGRSQVGTQSLCPPGQAKEDWKIIRALSEKVGRKLPFNTLHELRKVMQGACISLHPHFYYHEDNTQEARSRQLKDFLLKKRDLLKQSALSKEPFKQYFHSFYMTDVISRSSPTMAACVEAFSVSYEKATKNKKAS